jgi:hypothetical protein
MEAEYFDTRDDLVVNAFNVRYPLARSALLHEAVHSTVYPCIPR